MASRRQMRPAALLVLAVEFSEHADFDRAGLRENFIPVQQEFFTAGEIKDGYAHHALEVTVGLAHNFFQLLPEQLRFYGDIACRLLRGLRKSKRREEYDYEDGSHVWGL